MVLEGATSEALGTCRWHHQLIDGPHSTYVFVDQPSTTNQFVRKAFHKEIGFIFVQPEYFTGGTFKAKTHSYSLQRCGDIMQPGTSSLCAYSEFSYNLQQFSQKILAFLELLKNAYLCGYQGVVVFSQCFTRTFLQRMYPIPSATQ